MKVLLYIIYTVDCSFYIHHKCNTVIVILFIFNDYFDESDDRI